MGNRIKKATSRAKLAAIGGAIGAGIGGLLSREAASTGAGIGALVGATVGEKRVDLGTAAEQVTNRSGE